MAQRKLSKEELECEGKGWTVVIAGLIFIIACITITLIACPGWRPF